MYSSRIALSVFIFLAFAALAGAATTVSSCRALDSAGEYVLAANLSVTEEKCMNINASNVIFDCKGWWIKDTSGYTTIEVDGANNVNVQGCKVSFVGGGIGLDTGASNVTIFNNTFDGNGDSNSYAIVVGWYGEENGANNVIRGNSIRNSGYGMYVLTTSNLTVDSNSFDSCSQYGIQFETGSENMNGSITNNNFSNNGGADIELGGSYNYNISGNRMANSVYAIYSQGYYGVEYTNFTISFNTITNTSNKAIQVVDGSGNNITSNTITNASTNAIYVYNGDYNRIISNDISRVTTGVLNVYGIYLLASDHNLISHNSVNNSKNAILLEGSSGYSNITFNSVNNISYNGIQIADNYCRIESNQLYNVSDSAVYLEGTTGSQVLSNSITLSDYGVYLDSSNKANCSSNNITQANTTGIEGSQAYNSVISGNSISSSNYGVYLVVPSNMSVTQNALDTANYSIYFYLASGTLNLATDNIQSGAGPDLYTTTGMNWTYARSAGKIAFTNVTVNESTVGRMHVGTGVAAVNASALPSLNKSATITMTFGGYCDAPSGGPTLYYAPDYYTTLADIIAHGSVCDDESTPSCTQVSCSGSTVVFEVEHFDSYGGQGNDIPEFPALAALAAALLAAGGYAVARKRTKG